MAELTQDWREFLSLLISHRVRFVVVGGHAVAIHGSPRMTEDLDVFVEASLTNARRLRRTLVEFGFGGAAPDEELLAAPDKVFMIGVKPYRIDILTRISGVDFAEAWATRRRVRTEAGQDRSCPASSCSATKPPRGGTRIWPIWHCSVHHYPCQRAAVENGERWRPISSSRSGPSAATTCS
jgi:hypothetical protein